MTAPADSEASGLQAALAENDDPATRERLAVLLAQLGRKDEAIGHLRTIAARLPERPKGWRALVETATAMADPEAEAAAWGAWLGVWAELLTNDAEAADKVGEPLATRLFIHLRERIQQLGATEPSAMDASWRLVKGLYAEPAFGELAHAYKNRFADFVRIAGEDRFIKAAEKRGSDLSPCVHDALELFAASPRREELLEVCRADMAAYGAGPDPAERARRLLASPEFLRPVIICGFHHSGTRLLARQLQAMDVVQRVNIYQIEWTYVIQANTILEPGCMDPGRLGQTPEEPGLISPERIAWRMALAGLEPGRTWGFKDPRNGLTAGAWLKAFPRARIVHLIRDPVATLGTLPELYDQFVRLDRRRPTRTRFWADLWTAYVEGARRAMAEAEAAIEIRFEDLCDRPLEVLDQVEAALSLPAAPTAERLAGIAVKTGKTDLRAQVREQLSGADFEVLAGLARRYGYP